MNDLVLGIDPGKNGGWAILKADGSILDSGHRESYSRIKNYQHQIAVVCIEKVSNWPSDKRGQSIRMSPMIGNFGWWQGYCMGLELPEPKLVHPRTWRTYFGLVKGDALVFVNKVFDLKLLRKEDGQAVGILLADYGRKFLKNPRIEAM